SRSRSPRSSPPYASRAVCPSRRSARGERPAQEDRDAGDAAVGCEIEHEGLGRLEPRSVDRHRLAELRDHDVGSDTRYPVDPHLVVVERLERPAEERYVIADPAIVVAVGPEAHDVGCKAG